jgi:MFS family permease
MRGRVDLAINGTYWVGTILGALSTVILLDARIIPHAIGWRLCFFGGAIVGLAILIVRRHVPESPRWLLLHGKTGHARKVVHEIERDVSRHHDLAPPTTAQKLVVKGTIGYREIAHVLLRRHRRRTVLGLCLVISQAFAYNGVFFTYALVLTHFFRVPPEHVGWLIMPFAAANVLGPLLLGRYFDTLGRRVMIPLTYGGAGILLAITGFAFARGMLTVTSLTVLWSLIAFVASTAASSAYLTVSELFPVELRGMAIALFYAVGTGFGGTFAPAIFGALVETRDPSRLAGGYLVAAALLLGSAAVAAGLGVAAEGRSLEELSGA